MITFKKLNKSKTTLTIVVNPEINNETGDEALKNIVQKSDLFLIFTDDWAINKNPLKFSNLYEATYYGLPERKKETVVELIWQALDYGRELGGGYLGYFIVLEDLNNINRINIDSIEKLGRSLIESSVWKSERLNWEELRTLYTDNRGKMKKAIDSIVKSPMIDIYRSFEKETTNDQIIFLRESTLIKLEEYFKENKFYRDSFKYSTFKRFISSAVSKICPETKINVEIKDAKA
jgi:hypothetical protein